MSELDVLEIMNVTQEEDHLLTAQLGDAYGGTPVSDGAEVWHHAGFSSKPGVAEPGKAAAQAVVLVRGGRDIILASRDVRAPGPPLRDGETAIFNCGADGTGTSRVLIRNNGDIEIYSPTLVLLGASASNSAVLGEPLVAALATMAATFNSFVSTFGSHTHSHPMGPTGAPAAGGPTMSDPTGFLSSTVMVQP